MSLDVVLFITDTMARLSVKNKILLSLSWSHHNLTAITMGRSSFMAMFVELQVAGKSVFIQFEPNKAAHDRLEASENSLRVLELWNSSGRTRTRPLNSVRKVSQALRSRRASRVSLTRWFLERTPLVRSMIRRLNDGATSELKSTD